MVRHSNPWMRIAGPASLLAVAQLALSCSNAEQNNLRDKPKGDSVAQGPGTSEGDDDFTVAQPVPMALLEPTSIAENKERFDQSGAAGSYQDAADGDCASQIPPMVTDYDANGIPKNLCISFNIMSVPGYAAGEMKTLLESLLTLSSSLFGKNGFFQGEFQTKRAVNLFDVLNGKPHTVGSPSYVEVVIVNPGANGERPLYRVNLYFPNQSGKPDKFALNTSIEFSPLADDKSYAEISVQHYYLPPDTIYGQHLSAKYNTKTSDFAAEFGSAPVNQDIPARTSLRWVSTDEYFLIQGGYVWQKDSNRPSPTKHAAPKYYKPYTNDVAIFQSITQNDPTAKTVQSTAYLPAVDGALATATLTSAIWSDAGAGYTSDLIRYLVGLLRDSGVNGNCSTLRDTVVNAVKAAGHNPAPSALESLPENNMCSTNTAATDAQVETLLKESCKLIGVDMWLNISVEGQVQTLKVHLCRKLIEALLLLNHQYIEVMTDPGSGERYRQPKVEYVSDAGMVQQLLAKTVPDSDYGGLQEAMLSYSLNFDLSKFKDLSWPAVTTRGTDCFKNARGNLSSN